MSLRDDLLSFCQGLPDDWAAMLLVHGLNIRQPNAAQLIKHLTTATLKVDRTIRGFGDFASDAALGIVPRQPAQSLLYHAVASPNVQFGSDGKLLSRFPTLAEIELVENVVFGMNPPTVKELQREAKDALGVGAAPQLSAVIFAYEYRPASQTAHHKHADLAFSRTGIARVGTRAARYMPGLRGFVPESDADAFALHVSPARYAMFLAVQAPGAGSDFRPMRIQKDDDKLSFWIPLHKLFPGDECLKDLDLTPKFDAFHVNEKIFRLHQAVGQNPPNQPPYRMVDELATLVDSNRGSATVMPVPHPTLVEEARDSNGQLVTFTVPSTIGGGSISTLSTSLSFSNTSGPSYAHVRTELRNGTLLDLNQDDPALKTDLALLARIRHGGYQALNYIDFTAEGWVAGQVPELAGVPGIGGGVEAAYSLVSAPDFYPACDQRELTEWSGSSAIPANLQRDLWNIAPDTLCDRRLPANLQLAGNPFAQDETTMTAVVSLLSSVPQGADLPGPAAPRHSHLPDDAAGVFAPGWDVSADTITIGGKDIDHLAGYALGSPFPEDAKLCAALSTFWPAVAPDATREMQPNVGNNSGTVSPMTDEEIGIGSAPWDGVPGPTIVTSGGQRFAEFANFHRVDYVRNALNNRMTMRLTARVDAEEYQQRVLALALAYAALHAERTGSVLPPKKLKAERGQWIVLSFRAILAGDSELTQAQLDAGTILPGPVYRCVVFPAAPPELAPDFRRQRVALPNQTLMFADPQSRRVLLRQETESLWRKALL